FLTILVTGLGLWLPTARVKRDLRFRDGFMVVVLFWTVLAAAGAIPFYLSGAPALSVTDAFFESMSGLTTTGATVITGLDDLPASIRYYRQQLQWLGGMGIIVLAVAIMPMLGIGGMQLYRAETPGPMKDTKLTPRITETAKALWYIYLGLTAACAVSYWIAGMGWFDAIGHSFSTVAIGGFSTHDLSIGFFNNGLIDFVAVVFMLIAGINFSLHFVAWRRGTIGVYLRDPEAMVFLAILLVAVILALVTLYGYALFEGAEIVRQGVFQVVSIVTTTGYTTGGYYWWPSFLPLMLLLLSCVGGCAGSTAGGIKVIRIILLYKQGRREMVRLVHPSALLSIKLGGKPVPDDVIDAVWAFFSLYVLSFAVLGLAVAATGTDLVTALSAVAACLNNLGPGLGAVAENYAALDSAAKWILTGAMLLGRLELFTLLVLFTATFWRS
ncbi:MAG: TrkH family potassium uptake protein, partial [Gammaproteobacteria bacterium]|nr:TrkH family potassium uptake protein [Gammaproteobacteria bacterium]